MNYKATSLNQLADLFFVRGGYINANNQQLNNAGQNGDYWSSRANSDTNNAYELYFNANGVNPSSNTNRYNGQSLRCLSRASISEKMRQLTFLGVEF